MASAMSASSPSNSTASITQDSHFSDEPDFAPSIVHLLGWPVPDGWWGESMFDSAFMAPSISKIGRNLIVTPVKGPQRVVSLDHPNGDAEKGLVKLFFSVYTNSPSAGTVEGTGGSRDNSP
jgi:hypothetical protein